MLRTSLDSSLYYQGYLSVSKVARKVKAQPKLYLETAAQKYDRESSMVRNCAIQCLLCAHELTTNTQRRTDGAPPQSRPRKNGSGCETGSIWKCRCDRIKPAGANHSLVGPDFMNHASPE